MDSTFSYWFSEASRTYQYIFKIIEKLASCSGAIWQVYIEDKKTKWSVQG